MQTLRVLLREAEDALIRLNLVKARVAEEFAKQIEQEVGANASAKKRKVLGRLAEDERKAVANMDTYYREKLFTEPAKKKKAADKGESEKEDEAEPDDETLVLVSKRVRVMPRQKTPEAVQGKKD